MRPIWGADYITSIKMIRIDYHLFRFASIAFIEMVNSFLSHNKVMYEAIMEKYSHGRES